jgi:DsbC/DsbD-like thiol-disulfide interchange protein
MMKGLNRVGLILLVMFFIFCASVSVNGQRTPVRWQVTAEPDGEQVVLKFEALLAPGWHLYSQEIAEGGPIPTRFQFEANADIALVGVVEEEGERVTFHDDTYDMIITWYGERVVFRQAVVLNKPEAVVRVQVEYMVCNEEVCVPGMQVFSRQVKRIGEAR